MDEFLHTALSMPTLAFSLALAVILVYWLSVMVGALDLHFLDPGAVGADGVGEGAAEALGEAAAHGVAEMGHADVGHADVGDAGAGFGGVAGLLSALHLRSAPLTVTVSIMTLLSWLGSYFGSRYLTEIIPVAGWLSALLVCVIALAVSVPLTALITRPLAPLFKQEPSLNRGDLVGKEGTIRLSPGEGRVGQAELRDAGAALVLKVRVTGTHEVARGDTVLVLSYDEDEDVYDVEPLESVVSPRRNPRGARSDDG